MEAASATIGGSPLPRVGPSLPVVSGVVGDVCQIAFVGLEYWASPGRFLDRCSSMGDRFALKLPGADEVTGLTNPEDIRAVFTAGPQATSFAKVLSRFGGHHLILGEENIFSYDGAQHLTERRLISPPLHGEALKSYQQTMVTVTERAMEHWRYGEVISFREVIAPVALDIVMEVIFGISQGERLDRVRARTLEYLAIMQSRRFLAQTIWATARGGKWDGNYDYIAQGRSRLDAVIREEMDERRRTGEERQDVLGLFLATCYDDGTPMSEQQILDNMVALLLAGFETTGTTLAWLASEITRRRDVLQQLEEGARAGDDSYLDATITETLRLRPPTMATLRYLERDVVLADGLVLKRDTIAMPFIMGVHRRPDIYPRPLEFRPERFLEEQPGTYSWLPFGGGTRRCLGASFAMVEMREIMRTILQNARFRPVDTPPEGFGRNNLVMAPRDGGKVTLERIA